jgi:hypothetical protein
MCLSAPSQVHPLGGEHARQDFLVALAPGGVEEYIVQGRRARVWRQSGSQRGRRAKPLEGGDEKILATVRRASPFPPPPAGAPQTFSAPLSFKVR